MRFLWALWASAALSGCGSTVNSGDCSGATGTASVAAISNVSSDANVMTSPYAPKGVVERVHSVTPPELAGTFSLCNLKLTDTNRTLQFEIHAPLESGKTYELSDNNTGNGTFVLVSQGGINPADQRGWVSHGGSITLTTINDHSASVVISATGMSHGNDTNDTAKGTFDLEANATINF